MNYDNYAKILPMEKIIGLLTYISCGIVGLAWILLGAVMSLNMKPFLKYHIYQSIFLTFLYVIVSAALVFVLNMLGYIPFIGNVIAFLTYFFISEMIFGLSIIQLLTLGFLLYLCIGVIQGRYSYVPWVSSIIVSNMKRG